MLRFEREEEILGILRQKKRLRVEELGKLLYASDSSIRRDLARLECKGLVKRYYGGVELVQSNSTVVPFAARSHQNAAAKRVMAQKAAALIQEGDILFLDQSSSCLYLAQELLQRSGITVVTSNVEILYLLSQSQLEVHSCGGMLSSVNRSCLVGADAQQTFSQIRADWAFFATKALAEDGTIYDCTRQEVCLRHSMLAQAAKRVYLCDSSKIGKISGYKQCTLGQVDYLICERTVDESLKGSYPKLTVL